MRSAPLRRRKKAEPKKKAEPRKEEKPTKKEKKKELHHILSPKFFSDLNRWLDTVAETGPTFATEQLGKFEDKAVKVRTKRKERLLRRIKKMKSITPVNITVTKVKTKAAEGALKLGGMLDAEERKHLSAKALETWIGRKKKVT